MLNTHAPAIFILAFQNLHYLFFVKKNFKKWIFMQLLLFTFFLPLLLKTLSIIPQYSGLLLIPTPNITTLLRTFYIFSAGETFSIEALVIGSLISIGFFLIIFLVLFKDIKNRKIQNSNEIIFLILWLAVPILLLILQSYVFYSYYFERYIIVSSVALYLLVALSITRFNIKTQKIIMAIIVILSLMMLYVDFDTNNKGRWKDTADYIKMHKNSEDAVVVHVPNAIFSFAYYFDSECFQSDDLKNCMSMQNVYGVRNAEELPEETTNKEKVFLILYNAKYVDTEGTLMKYYSENYKLIEEEKYRHIQIFTFKAKTSE
tara:strand:- start:1176 stop:2126 length:951 start_codon:yes stop_codon:yes gene_type:complete